MWSAPVSGLSTRTEIMHRELWREITSKCPWWQQDTPASRWTGTGQDEPLHFQSRTYWTLTRKSRESPKILRERETWVIRWESRARRRTASLEEFQVLQSKVGWLSAMACSSKSRSRAVVKFLLGGSRNLNYKLHGFDPIHSFEEASFRRGLMIRKTRMVACKNISPSLTSGIRCKPWISRDVNCESWFDPNALPQIPCGLIIREHHQFVSIFPWECMTQRKYRETPWGCWGFGGPALIPHSLFNNIALTMISVFIFNYLLVLPSPPKVFF